MEVVVRVEVIKVLKWLECLASAQFYSRGNEPLPEFVPSVVRLRGEKLLRSFDRASQQLVDVKRLRAGELVSVETTRVGDVFIVLNAGERRRLQPDEFDVHEMRINQKAS